MPRPRAVAAQLTTAPLILDIGEAYTKFGFATEPSPRMIVPTTLKYSMSQGVLPPSQKQWEEVMMKFLRFLYTERIRINPPDRKVVVLENPFWTIAFKQAIATTLFALKVPAVRFVLGISLPIYLTGNESGLIVDVGFGESRVLPVMEGFPIMSALKAIPVGMSSVHKRFLAECKQEAELSRSQTETVVLRNCFVSGPKLDDSKGEVKQETLEGGVKIDVPYRARVMAANTLFGDNEDSFSIARSVVDSLRACSIDSRAALVKNVVLCGGTTMLPGFRRRLLDEVDLILGNDPLVRGLKSKLFLFESVFPANVQQFVGASLVSSLDGQTFIEAPEVKMGAPVPIEDWSTQLEVKPPTVAVVEEVQDDNEFLF
jgi:actin-related protein 10